MARTISGNYDALAWVQDEVQLSLDSALKSLTLYIDESSNSSALDACITQLYQTNGTVEMLNLQGASLLANEMMASAKSLHTSNEQDVQDSLLKSLLLLSNYLKLLSTQLQDHPLRLINSINELRIARGDTELKNRELFTPILSVQLPESIAPNPLKKSPKISVAENKLSPIYQVSLLNWFKESDIEHLNRMGKIVHYLRLISVEEYSVTLWWSASAVIESLLDKGLVLTQHIKLKLTQLSKPIELFTQQSEQQLHTAFPTELLHELLLIVSRSTSKGKHATLLKNVFELNFFNVSQHQKIYNFGGDALIDVHSELLDELQQIKDAVDQFDRQSDASLESLKLLPSQLSNIANTLQLLAENSASIGILHQQVEIFSVLSEQQQTPEQPQLTALADDLLQIEGHLRNIHINTDKSDEDIQNQNAVLTECLIELTEIRESFSLIAEQPEHTEGQLGGIVSKFELISAGLFITNLPSIARLLTDTQSQLTTIQENSSSISTQELTWFAEIISSCELYLEGIKNGGSPQPDLLINAQNILINFEDSSSLETVLELDENQSPTVEIALKLDVTTVEVNSDPSNSTLTKTDVERYIREKNSSVKTTTVEQGINEQNSSSNITGVERYIQAQVSLATDNSFSIHDDPAEDEELSEDGIDPEIADIFIEEAEEVLAELVLLTPQWQQDYDEEILSVIRRHYHTLKGSGHMAGAHVIADLSWSVENLLNNVLKNKVDISSAVTQLLIDSQLILPEFIARFVDRNLDQTDDLKALINTAEMLLVNPVDESKTPDSIEVAHDDAPIDLDLVTSDTEEEDDDDELQQIFNQEASLHINKLQSILVKAILPFHLDKELLRAAHSLKGCANIAQVMPVAAIATQLDTTLRLLYEQNNEIASAELSTLSTVVEQLKHYIDSLTDKQPADDFDILPLLDLLTQITPDYIASPSEDNQDKRIDPEVLVVFLEETDELLEQYGEQLAQLQQQSDNEEYHAAIHQTLKVLTDNASYSDLNVLADLYQLLDRLISCPDLNNPEISSLLEQGYEHVNQQVEDLIQNTSVSNIEQFTQQVEQQLNPPKEKPVQVERYPIPMDEPELIEAFTEELEELLESSGVAIKQWQADPSANQASTQLQRDLHTIKGGSRLTDLKPISDLTHQTESLVFMIVDQKQAPTEQFYELLQRSQDHLADMQEDLAKNEPLTFATALLNDIASFTGQAAPVAIYQKPVDDSNIEKVAVATGNEQIRVRADLLDFLTNFTGEVSISRDRVGQQNTAIHQQLLEMDSTVNRLQEQLRKLEIETETQILFRYEDESIDRDSEFDPLEFDRFSMIQQLSRSLTESVSDMHEITQSINHIVRDSDSILLQQSRLSADLEQGLMSSRLLPFTGLVPRFERIVRQVNTDLEKQSTLTVHGAEHELDRTILDRIVAPLEHILRNAIAHGIELPEQRRQLGKEETGQLTLSISREGSEVLISLADDGLGIDIDKVRKKALEQNLIAPDHTPSDEDLIQLILSSGFSTSDSVSQISGRGVGMDVVNNEIRALKGRLSIQSTEGKGTTFHIRLPMTLSIMQALMVSSHDRPFAIPLSAVHAGTRATVKDITALLEQGDDARFESNGEYYQFLSLAQLLEQSQILPDDLNSQLPILLFRYGDMHIALLVDEINSNREIVLKSMGEQLDHIDSITGATILGDGQVVFVLDIPALATSKQGTIKEDLEDDIDFDRTPIAMVVDDSITMRKVSSNLLKRHGFDVLTARDGIDAVAQLNEQTPDIILLDVEMPRMDGFEFATLVRNVEQYKNLPIIMITSRTGDKHRDRALKIGVDDYLGKPYQEADLLSSMQKLLGNTFPSSMK